MKNNHHIVIRVAAYEREHLVLRLLLVTLFVCIAAYSYFVGVSILNVIAHKEALDESDRLRSDVGGLERDFFNLSQAINPEMGDRLGLTPTSKTSFVRRPGAVGVATEEHNDI